MKMPFRFFRGEFNGFFLRHLVTCYNFAAQEIVDELVYQALFQWKLESEVTANEIPIREEDIFNIGKTAGLFQPRLLGRASFSSVSFTPSHIVEGKERSERGLQDMETEGYICDMEIKSRNGYFVLYFRLNEDITLQGRERRYIAWENIIKQKFKMFQLEQRFV